MQLRGASSRTRVETFEISGDLTNKCQFLEVPSIRVEESFVGIPVGPIVVDDVGRGVGNVQVVGSSQAELSCKVGLNQKMDFWFPFGC